MKKNETKLQVAAKKVKKGLQTATIGVLVSIGLIALQSEPIDEESWLATIAIQVTICVISWLAAWWLERHWGIIEDIHNKYFNK